MNHNKIHNDLHNEDNENNDQINIEKILTTTNRNNLFTKIFQDENNLIKLFITAFIIIFLIINILIYSIQFLTMHSDFLILQKIRAEDIHYLFYHFYYKYHPFLITLKKDNTYYNFTYLFYIFLISNIIYIVVSCFLYKKLLFYIKDIKEKVQIINQIQLKNEKDLLSAKIIEKIAEHINHEIKPSLLSLKNIIKEYENIISLIIKLANPNGEREIDKIVYPKRDTTKCLHCSIYNKNSAICQYYSWYGDPLKNILDKYKKIAHISLNQINATLEISKNLRSLKQKRKDISVYDVIDQSINIFTLMKKYKFNFKIDEKLQSCFLNGLSPEILSNILMNHIKNALEANATEIEVLYKGIEEKNDKIFLFFEFIDNGDGIPEKIIKKIYDLNFSTKNKAKNSGNFGVGLYLSKQLLNYYNGDENLKYTSENGTVFCFKIPVKYCILKEYDNYVCHDFNKIRKKDKK